MTSPRALFIPLVQGTVFLFAAGFASIALAQAGGMGPDPYRPYTSQYDAFIYPIAPGGGDVLPSEAALGRTGLSRNNQFQEYLRGSQVGAGNSSYRSQRQLDPQAFRESQYQPNRKVDEESGFYEKQESITQKYFAYLRERDPKKRAELLKEYQRARSMPSREFRNQPRRNPDDAATASRSDRRVSPRSRRFEADSSTGIPSPPRSRSLDSRAEGRQTTSPLQEGRATGSVKPPAPSPSATLEESLKRDREFRLSPSGRANSAGSLRSRPSSRIPSPPRSRDTSPSPKPSRLQDLEPLAGPN